MLYQLTCTRDPETAEILLDGGRGQLGRKLEMWSDAQWEKTYHLLYRAQNKPISKLQSQMDYAFHSRRYYKLKGASSFLQNAALFID